MNYYCSILAKTEDFLGKIWLIFTVIEKRLIFALQSAEYMCIIIIND